MAINFKEIFSQLKKGVVSLAETSLKDFLKDAKNDGLALLNEMKADLERWTKLLANGDITLKEFQFLLDANVASVKMEALKQAGLAAIKADEFKNGIVSMITGVVTKVIPV